jgi:hypothetical protein
MKLLNSTFFFLATICVLGSPLWAQNFSGETAPPQGWAPSAGSVTWGVPMPVNQNGGYSPLPPPIILAPSIQFPSEGVPPPVSNGTGSSWVPAPVPNYPGYLPVPAPHSNILGYGAGALPPPAAADTYVPMPERGSVFAGYGSEFQSSPAQGGFRVDQPFVIVQPQPEQDPSNWHWDRSSPRQNAQPTYSTNQYQPTQLPRYNPNLPCSGFFGEVRTNCLNSVIAAQQAENARIAQSNRRLDGAIVAACAVQQAASSFMPRGAVGSMVYDIATGFANEVLRNPC